MSLNLRRFFVHNVVEIDFGVVIGSCLFSDRPRDEGVGGTTPEESRGCGAPDSRRSPTGHSGDYTGSTWEWRIGRRESGGRGVGGVTGYLRGPYSLGSKTRFGGTGTSRSGGRGSPSVHVEVVLSASTGHRVPTGLPDKCVVVLRVWDGKGQRRCR